MRRGGPRSSVGHAPTHGPRYQRHTALETVKTISPHGNRLSSWSCSRMTGKPEAILKEQVLVFVHLSW
jgi:hypothetical protein